MTPQETATLLAIIAAIDNRNVEKSTLATWHDLIKHLDFYDARDAVKDHRRGSPEYLEPRHVLDGVRRIHRVRLEGFDAYAHLIADRYPDTPEGARDARLALLDARERIASGEEPAGVFGSDAPLLGSDVEGTGHALPDLDRVGRRIPGRAS